MRYINLRLLTYFHTDISSLRLQ